MLIPDHIKIYFYTQPVDMRKSIDTLSMLISEIIKINPIDGNLFLFVFVRDSNGCMEMSREHSKWLLASDKYSRVDTMRPCQIESFF